jgi:hypothetical protein
MVKSIKQSLKMTNKNIFRASFTVLDQWNSGNWEQAIKTYFKLEKFITPAMQAGREWHEKWAKHITDTKTMPIEFGGFALKDPIAEQKTVVHLDDWLDLVGIIDCYANPVVYEWKTGKSSSETYAGTKQGGIYAMLATLSQKYVERIEIHHFDQYRKLSDMSIIWVTPELMDESHNWIVTTAAEMHTYFEDNGLYARFGANLLNGGAVVNHE